VIDIPPMDPEEAAVEAARIAILSRAGSPGDADFLLRAFQYVDEVRPRQTKSATERDAT
jgi:hypothetical protein